MSWLDDYSNQVYWDQGRHEGAKVSIPGEGGGRPTGEGHEISRQKVSHNPTRFGAKCCKHGRLIPDPCGPCLKEQIEAGAELVEAERELLEWSDQAAAALEICGCTILASDFREKIRRYGAAKRGAS